MSRDRRGPQPQEMERLLEILEPWLRALAGTGPEGLTLVYVRRKAAAELCEFIREVADA